MANKTYIPEVRARYIAIDLLNGVSLNEIVSKYAQKWRVSVKTVNRYIVMAKEMTNDIVKETYPDKVSEAVEALGSAAPKAVKILAKALDNADDGGNPTTDAIRAASEILKKSIGDISKIETSNDENKLVTVLKKYLEINDKPI